MVSSFRMSSSRLPFGVITVAVSPTCLPSSARPIGEVVEIKPFATSDSSLVTSWYLSSSSLLESKTVTREPKPTLSLGMFTRFTMASSPIRFFNCPSRALTKTWRCLAMWYSAFSLRSPSATAFLISAGSSVVSSCSNNLISSASLFFTSSGIWGLPDNTYRTRRYWCVDALRCKERLYDGRRPEPPSRVAEGWDQLLRGAPLVGPRLEKRLQNQYRRHLIHNPDSLGVPRHDLRRPGVGALCVVVRLRPQLLGQTPALWLPADSGHPIYAADCQLPPPSPPACEASARPISGRPSGLSDRAGTTAGPRTQADPKSRPECAGPPRRSPRVEVQESKSRMRGTRPPSSSCFSSPASSPDLPSRKESVIPVFGVTVAP